LCLMPFFLHKSVLYHKEGENMKSRTVLLTLCALVVAGSMLGCGKGPALNWSWAVNGDEDNGGTSTITMTEGTENGKPAYTFKGNITNEYQYGFVNVKVFPDEDTLKLLKTAKGLSFKVLGDGDRYAVKITTSDITDYCYYEYAFETVEGEVVEVVVPIDYLLQPSWGQYKKFNQDKAMFIEYQTTRNGSPGPFEFKLWDIKLYDKKVPKQKPLPVKAKAKNAASDAESKGIGGDLGAFSLKLNDNFQYGAGYQGYFTDKRLFNGHKITAGETYTLKITYSTSRDLEDRMMIGLVDTTSQANYWRALTWASDDEIAVLPLSKAGEKVSATITLKTIANATGDSAPANALVFITEGEGKQGSANSGVQKAVTLDVTEFVFTKVE